MKFFLTMPENTRFVIISRHSDFRGISISNRFDFEPFRFCKCFEAIILFQFRAINNDGECETISTLSVIPVEGVGPSFVTKPRSREVRILFTFTCSKYIFQFKLGTAAIFSCVLEGDPTPEIKWEIAGNPIDPR